MSNEGFVRRHAVGVYFVLAFAISWFGSVLGLGPAYLRGGSVELTELWLPGLIMISGPTVAGLGLTYALDGREGLRALWGRLTRWRAGGWYAALLIFPILILATLVPLSILVSPKLTPSMFAPGIVMGLVAGLLEEIGWTGFALPRMRARHGILGASLALGFVHALWHGVADFLGNSNDFGEHWLPYFAGFFLFVMALRVLMGWVYANTESALLGQLMHASSTGFLGVLVPIGIGGSYWASFYTVYAVVIWGAAVVVVARYGEKLVRSDAHAAKTP